MRQDDSLQACAAQLFKRNIPRMQEWLSQNPRYALSDYEGAATLPVPNVNDFDGINSQTTFVPAPIPVDSNRKIQMACAFAQHDEIFQHGRVPEAIRCEEEFDVTTFKDGEKIELPE